MHSDKQEAHDDDDDDDRKNDLPTHIIRPLAVKATTVHPRVLHDFQQECNQRGIPAVAMQNAVQQSQEWHRKWTLQDETAHKATATATDDWQVVLPNHDHLMSIRQLGAKNPSLSDGSNSNNIILLSSDNHSSHDNTATTGSSDNGGENGTKNKQHHQNSPPLYAPEATATAAPVVHQPSPPQEEEGEEEAAPDDEALLLAESPQSVVQPPTPIVRPIPLRPTVAPSPFEMPIELPNGDTTITSASPLTLPSAQASSSQQQPRQHGQQQQQQDQLTVAKDSAATNHHANSIPSHIYEEDCFSVESMPSSIPSFVMQHPRPTIESAKDGLLEVLAIHGGDVDTQEFEDALMPLMHHYEATGWDARDEKGIYSLYQHTRKVEGMWLTLSKPTYFGNLGENPNGDPMYTLGRMAFDMFLPTQLVCSLQGNFNPIRIVRSEERLELLERCPKALQEDLDVGQSVLRTYEYVFAAVSLSCLSLLVANAFFVVVVVNSIVTAFTIEPHLADYPNAPNKDVRRPIKGIMTTYGYCLPDPITPNRLSIWFTGGKITPNDDQHDQREWKRLFSRSLPGRTWGEKVRVLAANLLMGAQVPKEMEPDGTMEFEFTRPLGGHGVAYNDVVYMDDTMRIVRGHRGTIFVFARIPDQH